MEELLHAVLHLAFLRVPGLLLGSDSGFQSIDRVGEQENGLTRQRATVRLELLKEPLGEGTLPARGWLDWRILILHLLPHALLRLPFVTI